MRYAFRPKRAVVKAEPSPPPTPPPTRVARMLALAHHVERQIEAGAIPDYAAAARALGLTRARLTQVMKLLLLAPVLQERVLVREIVATERSLRTVTSASNWKDQLAVSPHLSNHSEP